MPPRAGRLDTLHRQRGLVVGHGGAGAVGFAVGVETKIRGKEESDVEQLRVDNKQRRYWLLPGVCRAWVCGSAGLR